MTTTPAPAGRRVPMRIAACWGAGTLGTTTMLNGIAAVLLYYLVNWVKLEPFIAGALVFGAKLLDVFISPPMGMISDRTESRWGRRRPYLFGASFFCCLAFAMLFNVPPGTGLGSVYVWTGFSLVLFVVAYTAFQVPYMAMPAEMTDNYHERTRIMTWRVGFMTVGNMMGFAGCLGLVAAYGGDRAAYGKMGWTVGAIVGAAMLIAFFGTSGARETRSDREQPSLYRQLPSLLANRPLLVMMAVKVVLYAGIASFTAVMFFLLGSVLKREPQSPAVIFYGVVSTLATIAFIPVQAWVSRRMDKRNAYCLSLVGYGAVMLTWLASTPDESLVAFSLRAGVLGALNAGLFLHSNSMLADTFAYDHRLSGQRREGLLSASFSFVEKISMAFGPLVVGALLSARGFDKDLAPTDNQSASAVQAMWICFLWIPIASQLLTLVLMRYYRLKASDFGAAEPGRAPKVAGRVSPADALP
jgi:GPH family glycoside/pentoside/hexuronide:cation symporter